MATSLTNLRFGFIKNGTGEKPSRFHACEDLQAHRDAVVTTLVEHHGWWFASIVIEKNRVNPSIRKPDNFYPRFLNMVLRFILKGNRRPNTSRVLIYTDTLPLSTKTERLYAREAILKLCRSELGETPFFLMHHSSHSNAWLQVVDYCSWSVCRKWESGDLRTYDKLRVKMLAAEIAPMALGGTTYY